MSISRRDEQRLLNADERQLVDKTRGDALRSLSEGDLSELLKLLRDRQSRARAIANKQRREMRGKANPTSAKAATRNDGSEQKGEVLTAAVKRLNNERTRRAVASAAPSQTAIARKAYRLKKAAQGRSEVPSYRTAGQGMRDVSNDKYEDLSRRSEIGRVTKFVAASQAKRDARNASS